MGYSYRTSKNIGRNLKFIAFRLNWKLLKILSRISRIRVPHPKISLGIGKDVKIKGLATKAFKATKNVTLRFGSGFFGGLKGLSRREPIPCLGDVNNNFRDGIFPAQLHFSGGRAGRLQRGF
jgi:hypothetical protein